MELGVTEISITIHVVQAFPDNFLFCKKTLVCYQQVKLTLHRKDGKTYKPIEMTFQCDKLADNFCSL